MNNNTEKNKELFAFAGVFLSILGFMLIFSTRREDRYAMHYAKQGLILSIIASWILLVSLLLNTTFAIILDSLLIACLLVWFKLIFDSMSGEEKEFPLIGIMARAIRC